MKCSKVLFFIVVCLFALRGNAQAWTPLLSAGQAIDWSSAGVGGIPARPINCAILTSAANVAQINSALASCHAGETVYLEPGVYSIAGNITIPSNVTLRGAGANSTILNANGSSGFAITMGTGGPLWRPTLIGITGGANAGSTAITLTSASGLKVGQLFAIGETNNASYVTALGSEGLCGWCDGGWSATGSLARGQIVEITKVTGNGITISPALYSAYTEAPVGVGFNQSVAYAGVEDLQLYSNNTGYSGNFGMSACAYCWIKGVESNYTDGDHVDVYWGYHDEIRDSYFSNSFLHQPGQHDSDVDLIDKTSATLVENNIIERTHVAIMLEWGVAGNVVAYNYTMGEFDSGATNAVMGGVEFHGAHPQFNLLEGNVTTEIYLDSIWGSSSHTTAFRNWVVGTNRICSPMSGRGTVSCSAASAHYGFQAVRAMQISYLSTRNNFLANVVGSVQMRSLRTGYSSPGTLMAQITSVEYPSTRSYDSAAYGWSFGFGETGDTGTGTGCAGGVPPCHLAGTSASDVFHGNYNNLDGSLEWKTGITHSLPASFYLPTRPIWWGAMPFPATGPDVTGVSGPGGHSYGNPAQACYFGVTGGSDGGAGGPLPFNASQCYGPRVPSNLNGVIR